MPIRTIWQAGLLIPLCVVLGWAQAPAANGNPCAAPPQQVAAAMPPPGVQPASPQEIKPQSPPPNRQMSVHQKFNIFVQYTYSPYTFGGAVFDAGLAQATGAWHSYGGGMEGYGKRYGASLADSESGAFFGRFLFPVLLHEDPRYLRPTSRHTMPRIGYALSRVLVTHDDSGNNRPNFSLVLSEFAAAGMANAYYPREERGFGDTAARAGGGLLSTAEMNLLREFWPDIRNKLKKHEPKRIQKFEESPRISKLEQMLIGPATPPQCPPAESHPEKTSDH